MAATQGEVKWAADIAIPPLRHDTIDLEVSADSVATLSALASSSRISHRNGGIAMNAAHFTSPCVAAVNRLPSDPGWIMFCLISATASALYLLQTTIVGTFLARGPRKIFRGQIGT